MKFLLTLVGILAAGAFGYLTEPILRYQLTGMLPGATDDSYVFVERVDPEGNRTRIRIDIADLKPEQFPALVELRNGIQVVDATTGVTMQIEAGSSVKPLRIDRGELVVSPGVGAFEGRVAVTSTDLLQQLTADPRPADAEPDALAVRTDRGMDVVDGDMVGDSPNDVMDDATDDEPAMDVQPEVEPEPEPEPEPEVVEDTGPVDVVKTMQESIKAGEIKEFTFDQVTEWKEEENETIDGQEYQTGTAAYQKETFLGVQSIQAKALIRGGKVQRWVTAKSGFEIK